MTSADGASPSGVAANENFLVLINISIIYLSTGVQPPFPLFMLCLWMIDRENEYENRNLCDNNDELLVVLLPHLHLSWTQEKGNSDKKTMEQYHDIVGNRLLKWRSPGGILSRYLQHTQVALLTRRHIVKVRRFGVLLIGYSFYSLATG